MKTNSELFLSGLVTLRAQLLATVQTIEMILDIAERPAGASEQPDSGPCKHPHPARIPSPAMGHPNRFRCGICNQEVEEA